MLEYLANYPNCYKTVDDINNYLDEGCLSRTTIRGYIHRLRKSYNPVIEEVVTSNASGYKYIGQKIEDVDARTHAIAVGEVKKQLADVDEYASLLWKNRPFYQDEELISLVYFRNNFGDSVGYDENITYMIAELLKQSYREGKTISLNKFPRDTSNKLIVIKEMFLLEDVFCEGKHLSDFSEPYDLLGLDEEKITLVFAGLDKTVKTSMWLSGMKACMPMRHLVKIIFESNRIFHFQVWGYFDKIDVGQYYIKPLSVVYV